MSYIIVINSEDLLYAINISVLENQYPQDFLILYREDKSLYQFDTLISAYDWITKNIKPELIDNYHINYREYINRDPLEVINRYLK